MREQNKEHNVCFQRRFIGCILVSVALENEVSFDAHWISKAEDGAGRIVMNNNKPCLYSAYHIQREVSICTMKIGLKTAASCKVLSIPT